MAQAFWYETLACPRCRTPLGDAYSCGPCGAEYRMEDGTPCLLAPPGSTGEVRFNYVALDGDVLLDRVLAEPPTFSGDGLPYHLDRAHAHQIASQPAGARLLEIGCGGGQNRYWIEGRGLKYLGTDVSKTRVFEWLQRYGGPDLLCDAHFLPFRDQQFDVVYSAATTEHLASPQRVVQEIFRVLKPGGSFLSNVSFLEPWHDNSYFHMTPLGVVELLTRAGFEIEFVWPGRNYSGFLALPSMALRGPLKLMRHPGRAVQCLYGAQSRLRNVFRRLRNRPKESSIRQRSVVAGAIDWIARRPLEIQSIERESER